VTQCVSLSGRHVPSGRDSRPFRVFREQNGFGRITIVLTCPYIFAFARYSNPSRHEALAESGLPVPGRFSKRADGNTDCAASPDALSIQRADLARSTGDTAASCTPLPHTHPPLFA